MSNAATDSAKYFNAITTDPVESRKLYESRQGYKARSSYIFNQINNNYIDLWYDVPYYGKVDRNGILKVPNNFHIDLSNSYNISFLKRAHTQGRTQLGELLQGFRVRNSFFDSRSLYTDMSLSLMLEYNEYIIRNALFIVDYKTYICQFIAFLKKSKLNFSYYSVFASSTTNINATGLAIDLLGKNQDADREKNTFLQNRDFPKYVNTAANFGFRVNKNAPWMLIADLNSKPMLKGYTISPKNFNKEPQEITGYMPQHFIPSIDFLFNNLYDRVLTIALYKFSYAMNFGYVKYQNRISYLVDHGAATFHIPNESNMRGITFGYASHSPQQKVYINNYKYGSKEEGITTQDLNKHFDDYFYLEMLEKILKYEFKIAEDRRYALFQQEFKQKNNSNNNVNEVLDVLESFYNPTKIFNASTNRPMWQTHKNSLTPKKHNVMIPNEKEKPSIGKIVTEFNTGH